MTITKKEQDGTAIFEVSGRLDGNTSKELLAELTPALDGKRDITLDFAGMQFVSSAGLRVIFMAHKKCKAAGRTFSIENANESIKEIFTITGYSGV